MHIRKDPQPSADLGLGKIRLAGTTRNGNRPTSVAGSEIQSLYWGVQVLGSSSQLRLMGCLTSPGPFLLKVIGGSASFLGPYTSTVWGPG
jgi:hypothetical protein